ncbi:MAG: hypothetical protein ABIK84_00140 [candidate division WOR-3 bacterium]
MEEIKKEEMGGEGVPSEQISETAPPYDPEVLKAEITKVVKDFLTYFGIRGKVEIKEQEEGFYCNIRLRAMAGFLIGKNGNTLKALQHLVTEILRKKFPQLPPVVLDVAGYRMRRVNFLRKKALAIARVVIETKREMAFDFLTPRELKIVADALADIKEVKIWTIGSGAKRNVIIAPNL